MRAWINRHPRLMLAVSLTLAVLALSPVPQTIAQNFAVVFVLDGSAGAPSMTFNNNTNRGFYNDVANTGIGGSVAGSQVLRLGARTAGHVFWGQVRTSGTVPAVDNSHSIVGTDQAGKIQLVSAQSAIIVTFANAWNSSPVCVAQNETRNIATRMSSLKVANSTGTTSAQIDLASNGTIGDVISYSCMGKS